MIKRLLIVNAMWLMIWKQKWTPAGECQWCSQNVWKKMWKMMARHTLHDHWLGSTIPFLLPPLSSSAMSAHTRGAILNRDGAQAQTLPFSMKCFESCCELCVCVLRFVTVKWNLKSFKAFMATMSDSFKVTHIFWEFGCLLMFAKATKWLHSVTYHQSGHVVKEKTVSFPFPSDFFCTWSSLHCFVNFFVSEAEASNEAKNTGRDNTKSKRGEQTCPS